MTSPTSRRRLAKLGAFAMLSLGGLTLMAAPATADSSRASAVALRLTGKLLGAPVLDLNTGLADAAIANNDGTHPTVIVGTNKGPDQISGVVQLGILGQTAAAYQNGSTAACAGLLQEGGTLAIGAGGCEVGLGSTPAHLGIPGLLSITAEAITAFCGGSQPGDGGVPPRMVVGGSRFAGVGLRIGNELLGQNITIPLDPQPNFGLALGVPGILTGELRLNEQIHNPDGSLTVNAFRLTLDSPLLDTAVELVIGSVRCQPATTPFISMFSGKALPLAGGTAVLMIGGAVLYHRRRSTFAMAA